ncbi:MAG: hypothetical protein H0W84_02635 [Bacteroidetes bacterium]|nr:hypothetical protein [Bacteroidota bacterium]
MKKIILIIFSLMIGMNGYAQSAREKKAAQTDLDNIKRLYDRLKEYKIDTKIELLWVYTYEDTTQTRLEQLSQAFEKGDMKTVEIGPSKKSNKKFFLKVSEVKKYTKPEALNERVKHLNEVASVYQILTPYAAITAEKQEKEAEIGKYKKVGIGKEEKK